jgi:hypothetical protein
MNRICKILKDKWCGDSPSRTQTEKQLNRKSCGTINKNACNTYNYKNSNKNKKQKEIAEKKARLIARREELRERNRRMKEKQKVPK